MQYATGSTFLTYKKPRMFTFLTWLIPWLLLANSQSSKCHLMIGHWIRVTFFLPSLFKQHLNFKQHQVILFLMFSSQIFPWLLNCDIFSPIVLLRHFAQRNVQNFSRFSHKILELAEHRTIHTSHSPHANTIIFPVSGISLAMLLMQTLL